MDSIVVALHIAQCSDQQCLPLVARSVDKYQYEQGMPKDSVHTNETNPNKSMIKACMVYEVAEWSELRSFLALQMHVIH